MLVERAADLVWILDHLDDVDADMRRFYGMSAKQGRRRVSGRRWFALVERLPAFGGVLAARARVQDGPAAAGRGEEMLSVAEAVSVVPGLFEVVRVGGSGA